VCIGVFTVAGDAGGGSKRADKRVCCCRRSIPESCGAYACRYSGMASEK